MSDDPEATEPHHNISRATTAYVAQEAVRAYQAQDEERYLAALQRVTPVEMPSVVGMLIRTLSLWAQGRNYEGGPGDAELEYVLQRVVDQQVAQENDETMEHFRGLLGD